MSKTMSATAGISADVLAHVEVELTAHVGKVRMTISELMALSVGSTLALDSMIGDEVEVRLNDVLVAAGDLAAVDDNFAVRITRIVEP